MAIREREKLRDLDMFSNGVLSVSKTKKIISFKRF